MGKGRETDLSPYPSAEQQARPMQQSFTDHHEGYITWAIYGRNQRLIADNANCKGNMVRGAIRRGEALLVGLLRCGHCGRNLHIAYTGKNGNTARYECRGALVNHGTERCIAFGALRVDRAIGAEVIRLLQPLGIDAALQAMELRDTEVDEVLRQAELALERARYEAAHARRQYDAVDPDNRLVAAELEHRWNEQLLLVQEQEERVATLKKQQRPALTPKQRDRLMALGMNLDQAWNHENALPETRKRILRTVINEVVACIENDQIVMQLHWQGGDHTTLSVRKNRYGRHRWTTDMETTDLIRELARVMPDNWIAATLNRSGKRTGKGEHVDRGPCQVIQD